jgi:O-acetyl-ADP-ribose deacetylase (regulator of RNase III)
VLREVEGDLFDSDASLVHACSADLRMGKGIARSFLERFGGVEEMRAQRRGVGQVAVLADDAGPHQRRFIFTLINKTVYHERPTYDTMRAALASLRDECRSRGVKRLAMPQIGSGLDKLEWPRVRELVRDVFRDADVEITVYRLPPRRAGEADAGESPRAKRPKTES